LFEGTQYQEKQIGFLTFIGDRFAGGEVFDSAGHYLKQMKKLLRGYYLDVVDEGAKFAKADAEEILKQISNANQEQFSAIGKERSCVLRLKKFKVPVI